MAFDTGKSNIPRWRLAVARPKLCRVSAKRNALYLGAEVRIPGRYFVFCAAIHLPSKAALLGASNG